MRVFVVRMLMLTVLPLLSLGLLAGCATLTQSGDEVRRTYGQVASTDMRQLSADWNYFWLMDRQSRLSEWYLR